MSRTHLILRHHNPLAGLPLHTIQLKSVLVQRLNEPNKNRRRESATAAHAWEAAGLLDDHLRDSYH